MQDCPETIDNQSVFIKTDYIPFVNFAVQQNGVELLKSLAIVNNSSETLRNLRLTIWNDPPVFAEQVFALDEIKPQTTCPLADPELIFLREPLRRQTEREEGQMWAKLRVDDTVIFQKPYPLSILAYNEWHGSAHLPELLSAHILPNDGAVERILKKASDILEKQTGESALSGYQAPGRQQVYFQAAAIYWAVASHGIRYVHPPASFETSGQKIRTPSHVLARRLGTCLDIALLFAACFEQAGLHAVAALTRGHAFPGLWLEDQASLDDPVTRYASPLLNRAKLNELLFFEATSVTKTPPLQFKKAIDLVQPHLQRDDAFHFALDLQTVRKTGIRPLSLGEPADSSRNGEHGEAAETERRAQEDFTIADTITSPGTESPETGDTPNAKEETPSDRLGRWKKHLLDLSLRNRLLNFKDTKKVIPLLCTDIASLEDALADGKVFTVHHKLDVWGEDHPADGKLHRNPAHSDALNDYLRDTLKQHKLHTTLNERDTALHLKEIERAARLGLEEGGANTLFLALGFLNWFESEASDTKRRAPIILLPMEITRKSIREGFRIRQIDEESRINITLLEKLKLDFDLDIHGLDPLPEDEHGLDVEKILYVLRNAIKHQRRWTIEESARLSILTFSRFLMWHDLENNAETLKENEVVRHLVETPTEQFNPDAAFPDPDTLDDLYPASETFCPLPADSSQLQGVFAAAEGRTFVLQGPPGTGKSQTITNIIAHCLSLGKRVLFVAQKRAALEVVQQRLRGIGLDPFCLELHSNKTTKTSFRRQLNEALSVTAKREDNNWKREAEKLERTRKQLNDYAEALHRERAFGKSAYWVLGQLIRHKDTEKVKLEIDPASEPAADDYRRMLQAVEQLIDAVKIVGNPAGHPLEKVHLKRYTYGLDEKVHDATANLKEAVSLLRSHTEALAKELALPSPPASLSDLRFMEELVSLYRQAPMVTNALLDRDDWETLKPDLDTLCATGLACSQTRASLLETYEESFFSLDLAELAYKLESRKDAWFLKRFFLGQAIKKTVAACRSDGKKPGDFSQLHEEIEKARQTNRELDYLENRSQEAAELFGGRWNGIASDWKELENTVAWTDAFRSLLKRAPGDTAQARLETISFLKQLAVNARPLFASGTEAEKKAAHYTQALENFTTLRADLSTLLEIDPADKWTNDAASEDLFDHLTTYLDLLDGAREELRQWTHYQSMRANACELKLDPLLSALEEGQVACEALRDVFEHSIAHAWAETILPAAPELERFLGERHNQKIRNFRGLKQHIARLARDTVRKKIADNLPRTTIANKRTPASSEAGQLQRFAQGSRKSIRYIFRKCPNALAFYKPCVLMSPLSVAQFIGADFPPFDLVVFDEASQMPTYEAIGAIARGKALIVVGDSKQLPPTTFFEKQKDDEEFTEDDLPEELESILDEAEAAGIHSLPLKWHYRSRHESLIAFSNHQYYANSLYTFPAALDKHPTRGVTLQPVPDGAYDHARTRTNRREAEAVVKEVLRRLTDPVEQKRSLGIVTFSIAQQLLVEDLLEQARSEHPEIEQFFTTAEEPVFVKNLETVQGDERDVIMFSICYGPDGAGVVRMNFGPLNNKGGERRLNVAITRARQKLLVFSTLRADQIDLSRTKAIGVHHLKTFLEYAQRGPAVLSDAARSGDSGTAPPFEEDVYCELVADGWKVDKQVGCSNFRVDLAVHDPARPGRFLLGILCDGVNYTNAATAGDRDHIRLSVLEDLGWNVHRMWSNDWCFQKQRELGKLKKALKEAQTDAPVLNTDAAEAPPPAPEEKIKNAPPPDPPEKTDGDPAPPGQALYLHYESQSDETADGDFNDPEYAAAIRKRVLEITAVEAPILFKTLCTKVIVPWDIKRTSPRIYQTVSKAIKRTKLKKTTCGERTFIWRSGQNPEAYSKFRVPALDDPHPRSMQEICPEETANAAAYILSLHISMSREDLSRETAKLFGISRLGSNVRSACDEAIELLEKQGRCRFDGDRILLPETGSA